MRNLAGNRGSRIAAASPLARTPAHASAEVRIGTLGLSLPGQDRRFGQRVAERASALIAERCPVGLRRDLDRIALTVHPRSYSEEALSESIAEAVLAALQR